ncbi:MAG: translocation/assembly module TamB domain-containing protein [Proteobacteria bacterium]|nr:translocation/assembly module TamB domain-containing protein [Pseudomonadota bacterium]HQR03179.1 translocation/assembly module TamB domain-containing protein [Rhodocyclaceae bacterium]
MKRPSPRLLITLLLLLASATGAALFWLTATEAGLRWALTRATSLAGKSLRIDDIHGALLRDGRIDTLVFASPARRISVSDLQWSWSPGELLQGRLVIRRLAAAGIDIEELAPDTTPLRLPDTLALPLEMAIQDITVNRLRYRPGPLVSQEAGPLRMSLALAGNRYRLQLQSLTTPWGKLAGSGDLGASAPFTLNADLRFTGQREPALMLAAGISGSLEHIGVKASFSAADSHFVGSAQLTPFASKPVESAQVDATGIDPARWSTSLPRAELAGSVEYTATQGGTLRLRNARPAAWDHNGLPLQQAALAFQGQDTHWRFREIDIDLGAGGRLRGGGTLAGKVLSLDLAVARLNPAALHSRVMPMALDGSIRLEGDTKIQHANVRLADRRFRLALQARRQDGKITLDEARLGAAGSTLQLQGEMTEDEPHRLRLEAQFSGFDPSAFGRYPSALLNGRIDATGVLAPTPAGTIAFSLQKSRFRGQPLTLDGHLGWDGQHLTADQIALQVAENRLTLAGRLGHHSDTLHFAIEAPRLSALDAELQGRLSARGALTGRLVAPSGEVTLDAAHLAWGKDYLLTALHAHTRLAPDPAAPLALDVRAEGLTLPGFALDLVTLAGHGSQNDHHIEFRATNPKLDMTMALSGRLQERFAWHGRLERAGNRGPYAFDLQAPATIALAPDRIDLQRMQIAIAGGRVTLDSLNWSPDQWRTQGQADGLALSALLAMAGRGDALETDLKLGGRWQVNAGKSLAGSFTLQRQQGDIVLPFTRGTTLGLTSLSASLEASEDALSARIDAQGKVLGKLHGEASTRLERRDGRWGLSAEAPLRLAANLETQTLSWLGPLLDPRGGLSLDGRIAGILRGTGTLGRPAITGSLQGSDLALRIPDLGVRFQEGGFRLSLDGEQAILSDLRLRSGNGQVTGAGNMTWGDPQPPEMHITFKADHFQALSRPDRQLVLSGEGNAVLERNLLSTTATLQADLGRITLTDENAPSSSEDVILAGRKNTPAPPSKFTLKTDIGIDLGDDFRLRGQGLEARFGGKLRLTGSDRNTLRANGSIAVREGRYRAYGQELEIERGVLNFQGPLDNPGLDILAMRKNQKVEAGVAISGTAHAPRVTVVSRPEVPNSEKLSWLVLGYGLGDSSGNDGRTLQAAASALLAAGESVTLQQQIAQATGLDEISLKGTGTVESSVLTLGKRLSSKAYLSYEQGLAGATSVANISYQLSKRLSLRARGGTSNALDIFYTIRFD